MTEDPDIRQAARNFVDRFGDDAPAEARRRAIELREAGNMDGHATWMAIHAAVKRLAEGGPGGP